MKKLLLILLFSLNCHAYYTPNALGGSTIHMRVESGSVTCSSSSSISTNYGSWISAIGNVSTGACTITLKTGTFTQIPMCTVGIVNDDNNRQAYLSVNSTTSIVMTGVKLSDQSALTVYQIYMICYGPY